MGCMCNKDVILTFSASSLLFFFLFTYLYLRSQKPECVDGYVQTDDIPLKIVVIHPDESLNLIGN